MNVMDDPIERLLPTFPHESDESDLTDFVLEDDAPHAGAIQAEPAEVKAEAESALKTVYDPEIPVNIYDLGLVYGLDVDPAGRVECSMTLTAPGCPVAGSIVREVHAKLLSVQGVTHVRTQLVWDPPWT